MSNKTTKLIFAALLVGCFWGQSAAVADEYYYGGETVNIDRIVNGYLWIDDATVNLLKNAHIKTVVSGQGSVFSSSGCVLNIYGGKIDDALYITTSYNSLAEAKVTVYGYGFAVDGAAVPVGTPEIFIPYKSLSGFYEDGTPFSFKVDCYAETGFYLTVKLGWIIASPKMAVALAALNFGQVRVDSSAAQTVTVSNTGDANLTLQSVGLLEGSSKALSIAPLVQLPVTIEPGAAIHVEVVFNPIEMGSALGVLRIAGDDSNNAFVDVSLAGIGIKPILAVEPVSLSFGQMNVGDSAVKKLTITNQGNTTLTVNSAMFAAGGCADFAVTAMADVPLMIEPNGLAEVQITYTATVKGDAAAVLQIASDDLETPLAEVAVNGKAVSPVQSPLEQAKAILVFYDNAVKNKTLTGVGPGKSDKAHLNATRSMLACAKCLIQGGYKKLALLAIYEADEVTDGKKCPKDFIDGAAKAELNAKIKLLIKSLKEK